MCVNLFTSLIVGFSLQPNQIICHNQGRGKQMPLTARWEFEGRTGSNGKGREGLGRDDLVQALPQEGLREKRGAVGNGLLCRNVSGIGPYRDMITI